MNNSRIDYILDSVEFSSLTEDACYFFETMYDLCEMDRYEADMRISGLYYRTSSVDMNALYKNTEFINHNVDCDIRKMVTRLKQPHASTIQDCALMDGIVQLLCEVCENEDGDFGSYDYFPFTVNNILTFETEPDNKYDRYAIKIKFKGKHCGYVPKEHASVISKKYSASEIKQAVGIIREKVGDARVTFDIYLPKQEAVKKPKLIEEDEECEDWEQGIDWDEECEAIAADVEDAKKAKAEPLKEDKGEFEGDIRTHATLRYTEEWRNGKWIPMDRTSRFDVETNKILVWIKEEHRWRERTTEEQEQADKDLATFMARWKKEEEEKEAEVAVAKKLPITNISDPILASTIVAEKPVDAVKGQMVMTINGGAQLYTGKEWVEVAPLVSPTFVSVPAAPTDNTTTTATTAFVTSAVVKWKKPIPVPLDYKQYTGFMRTVLEYATFAHVR